MRTLLRSRGFSRMRPANTKSSGWLHSAASLCSRRSCTSSGSRTTWRTPAAVLETATLSTALAQIEVAPAQVRQLRNAQAAGHDRRCEQRPVRSGCPQQDLNLLAAESRPPRLGLLQLLDLPLDRVVLDQLVADGRVENLAEPRQRLVDRPVRQWALDQALLALADLRRLVAVHFLRGDLREPVILEERQQVMAQRKLVVLDGASRELVTARIQPLRGELVEGRLRRWLLASRVGSLASRFPVRTSARTFASSSSALRRVQPSAARAERQVATLAIGAEAQREGASSAVAAPSRPLALLLCVPSRLPKPPRAASSPPVLGSEAVAPCPFDALWLTRPLTRAGGRVSHRSLVNPPQHSSRDLRVETKPWLAPRRRA